MSGPSLREIRIFVATYEEQSFTAAANREHATQSGVSQHIRNLENRMGVQLLTRNKGVQPTPAGVAYYHRCIDVLRAHAVAQRTLEEFAVGLAGDVTVGLPPTLTPSVLAPAFLRLNGRHPNINVRVVEAYAPLLGNALRAGELDFAILPFTGSDQPGVKATLFASTPEFFMCNPQRGLTDGTPVRLADIRPLKLVVPGATNVRRKLIEQYLKRQSIQLDARLEFDTMPGTLELVAQSDWSVIFPGLMIANEFGRGKFSIHPMLQPFPDLDLYLMEPDRQPLSAAAVAVLDQLREVSDEVGAELFQRSHVAHAC